MPFFRGGVREDSRRSGISVELITRSWLGRSETSPAGETLGEGGEGAVEFGAAFPADGESFEPVGQGEGLLDDVAEPARAADVHFSGEGDEGKGEHPRLSILNV